MQVTKLIVRQVHIPLRKPIRHASFERAATENLIVECHLKNGIIGYGEGVPREYVTGETIDDAVDTIRRADLAALRAASPENLEEAITAAERIRLAPASSPPRTGGSDGGAGPDDRGIRTNAARCAVELAYLDAACRAFEKPLGEVTRLAQPGLYEPKRQVRYSAAITSATGWKLRLQALVRKWYGFRQCKVKVGIAGQDDVGRLRIIRKLMGRSMELRLDANEAWKVDEAAAIWERLAPFGIQWVEQPVAHAQMPELGRLRRSWAADGQPARLPRQAGHPQGGLPTPHPPFPPLERGGPRGGRQGATGRQKMLVMLDESLCGMVDAKRCLEEDWGDLFNLRLSKCGGYLNTLRLAAFAEGKVGCQLGCQVGETAILSAAGRHFACTVKGLLALEGSYDRWLVREALSREDITFGRGGLAPALDGPGLGIRVDRDALQRVTIRQETIFD
jgi:L-alanine-DL-glutamate epimerase-like enolase superfamily enzyme